MDQGEEVVYTFLTFFNFYKDFMERANVYGFDFRKRACADGAKQ